MTARGLIAVVPEELANGFRLAGVETLVAETHNEALEGLDRILASGSHGVIAVYEPYLRQAPSQRRFEESVSPVVVPLPAGLEIRDEVSHRIRISALLSRAVGYHITFGESGSP